MKIKELIVLLEKMPQEALVVVRGYESGYDDIECVTPVTLTLTDTPDWFMGVYEEAENAQENIIEAVFIQHYNNEDKHEIKQGKKIAEQKLERANKDYSKWGKNKKYEK